MIVAQKFRGPPQSGNGGYCCGMVGASFDGPAEVTLRKPPPLDRELRLIREGETAFLKDGDIVIADGRPAAVDLAVPAPVSFEAASEASKRYPWFEGHPYPSCFVCGPHNPDGLHLFPGAVPGTQVAAAPWIPDASLAGPGGVVRPEIVWAALDCPGWFGFECFNPFDGKVLLGRLAARVAALPNAGDRCVCSGWFLGREGRKIFCAAAVHDERGKLLAAARSTWIALKE